MRITKQSSCPAPSVSRGGGGSVTGNESFITVNDDTATLPNSRQIAAGTGISIVDGGAGNIITINGKDHFVDTIWIPANLFEPASSPDYSPAPKVEIVLPVTGRQICAVKFDGACEAVAPVCFPYFYTTFGGLLLHGLRMYWFTDGTDVANTFAWRIGGHDVNDGSNIDQASDAVSNNDQLSGGSYILNGANLAWAMVGGYPTNTSIYHLLVQRATDSNNDVGYLYGVRCSVGVPLS